MEFLCFRNLTVLWKRAVLVSPSFKNRMRECSRAMVHSKEAGTRQCRFSSRHSQPSSDVKSQLSRCKISRAMANCDLTCPTCFWLQDCNARVRRLSLIEIRSRGHEIGRTSVFHELATPGTHPVLTKISKNVIYIFYIVFLPWGRSGIWYFSGLALQNYFWIYRMLPKSRSFTSRLQRSMVILLRLSLFLCSEE
jgi:hypothetical protein